MKLTTSVILMSGLLLSLTPAVHAAPSYKWTDEQGNVHYSQHPPRDRESQRLNIKVPRSSTGGQTQAPSATHNATFGSTGSSSSSGNIAEQESKKNKELRKQNCEAAKKNLQIYQVSRTIRDPSGKVINLTDSERTAKIEETKKAINNFCE